MATLPSSDMLKSFILWWNCNFNINNSTTIELSVSCEAWTDDSDVIGEFDKFWYILVILIYSIDIFIYIHIDILIRCDRW